MAPPILAVPFLGVLVRPINGLVEFDLVHSEPVEKPR